MDYHLPPMWKFLTPFLGVYELVRNSNKISFEEGMSVALYQGVSIPLFTATTGFAACNGLEKLLG